jgi:hypothetical protein
VFPISRLVDRSLALAMRRYGRGLWLGIAFPLAIALSSCSSPAVPAATSYGHGPWAFSVSFLAPPTHTGVRRAPAGYPSVAQDIYQARFKTEVGVGIEHLLIVEFPNRLTGTCLLGRLFHVAKSCPLSHGDILFTGVQTCPYRVSTSGIEHASILGIACHGYTGSVIAFKGKIAYELQLVSVSQSTAKAVLSSLSLHT